MYNFIYYCVSILQKKTINYIYQNFENKMFMAKVMIRKRYELANRETRTRHERIFLYQIPKVTPILVMLIDVAFILNRYKYSILIAEVYNAFRFLPWNLVQIFQAGVAS